ncbi:LpxI family protein [Tateyamaria armeniaca]|uniref:LpxI family protein n=1 Tax=Tateyamaria armeniaca TaxID=2518930 RepID=A0ABW8UW09_9RHOB
MLALIAGRGALPAAVARTQDDMPLIASLEGHIPDGLAVDISFRIEHLGSFLDTLAARGVQEVCFCGSVTRPVIDQGEIDAPTAPLVPVLAAAVAGGEDSALRAIVGIFENAGFVVRGADELAPQLLPEPGVLTRGTLPPEVQKQALLADQVRAEQAARDLGQACVIRGDAVIAREDARGTDAMLRDLAGTYDAPTLGGGDPFTSLMDAVGDALQDAADWLSGPVAEARAHAEGGVLFKAPKPGQDRRVDLPTIGPDTAMRAAEAGLDGIVIAAGGVMVLDQPQVTAILNEMGMFLWVR